MVSKFKKLKTEFDLIQILHKTLSVSHVFGVKVDKRCSKRMRKKIPLLILIWVSKQVELDDVFDFVEKVEEKNRTKNMFLYNVQ